MVGCIVGSGSSGASGRSVLNAELRQAIAETVDDVSPRGREPVEQQL
jgi:hypothetical protein